jgi:WD40 repeat protein
MSVQIRCPSCDTAAQVKEEWRGKSVRCQKCRTVVKIPLADPTIAHHRAAATLAPETAGLPTYVSPVAPSTAVPSANRIGRFELKQRLGAGAFGEVHRAFDPQMQREVALKLPLPGTSAAALERFLREARAAAGLCHPHIVPVFDAGEEDGRHYIASEFVAGKSLAALIDDKPLEPRQAAQLVRSLAEALAYAHRAGIVHRDVKSLNVLVDEQGEPHLLDFGLAHIAETLEQMTSEGAILGTPAYMAPEQARGQQGKPLPASDQYSLGVVLYELLTGRTPFEGPPAVVLTLVLNRDPEPPRKRNPRVPRALETICLKAMAKEPGRRYADCAALADDLRRWLDDEPIQARRLSLAERAVRWCKRRPALTALTLVTTACLLVVGVVASRTAAELATKRTEITKAEATARADAESAQKAANEVGKQAAEADKAIELARAAEQKAREQIARAKTAKEQADRARDAARTNSEKAEDVARDGMRRLFIADMELARKAHARGDLERFRMLRDRYLPGPGQRDLRDSEWYRIANLQAADSVVGPHAVNARGMAFSLQGTHFARAEEDKSVRVADTQSGKELLALAGHADMVTAACFSPDGNRLATVSYDQTARLWDARTGQKLCLFKGHTSSVWSVCFSADGQRLATGAEDRTVRVWDAVTGRELLVLQGHKSGVTAVCFSPDGKRLASGGTDAAVKVWDTVAGEEMRSIQGHADWITALCFHPDGGRLASASADKTVRVWDSDTGQMLHTLQGHTAAVRAVAFSADGKRLASAGDDRLVKVWEVDSGQLLRSFPGHADSVVRVAFHPDGKSLASGSKNLEVKVWDLERLDPLLVTVVATLKGHAGSVSSVCYSPDGKRLATAGADRSVRVWDAATGRELLIFKGHTDVVNCVCFSPDGKRLASAGADNTVKVWDAVTGQEIRSFIRHSTAVRSVCFSPDGKRLASGAGGPVMIGELKEVKVWDAATGQEFFILKEHAGEITSICFSPDGKRMASAGGLFDQTVIVWDTATGEKVHSLRVENGGIRTVDSVAFSPDGKRLASATGGSFMDAKCEVTVWDAAAGRTLLTLEDDSPNRYGAVSFSPDGTRLVSGHSNASGRDNDGIVKLWDSTTGKLLLTLNAHRSPIRSVCFSPDGKRVASAGDDGSVKVWDLTQQAAPKP